MRDELLDPGTSGDDESNDDVGLRPKRLADFVGQRALKEHLSIVLEAARKRGQAADHLLFAGPPGLGKTSLSAIVAAEMGVHLHVTSGPALERAGDLAAILTKLEQGDVLFIDEIHRLSRSVEEILYPAMEDFQLDIVVGKGPAASSIRLTLPPFTLVGATTRTGMITGPLRDRFGLVARLDYYDHDELESIVTRAARILGVSIDDPGAREIAGRSRGTPRIANRLLRRVRDFAEVRADGVINRQRAAEQGARLEVSGIYSGFAGHALRIGGGTRCWTAVVTADGRKVPATDAERADALRSMIAYTGRYRVEEGKVVTRVEAAWNEWYDAVHLPDALACPGVLSGRRYVSSGPIGGTDRGAPRARGDGDGGFDLKLGIAAPVRGEEDGERAAA